ncbi:MAG: hypothetical protein AAFW65_03200 [Pseudomonadota bacterium]
MSQILGRIAGFEMVETGIHVVLGLAGLFFLFTGIMSFLQPAKFARSLSLETVGRSGCVEIQAQYGGFFFLAGLSLFAPLAGLISQEAALIVMLVIFGGLIAGRLGSLLTKQASEPLIPMIRTLYLIDGAGFAAALAALLLINGVAA